MKPLARLSSKVRQVMLMAVIVITLSAVQPLFWNIVQTRAERLRDRQTQKEQLTNVDKQIEETMQAYTADKASIARLELPFPQEGTTPQIIERLEQVAGVRGVTVKIDSIVEQAPQLRRRSVLVPLTVNIRANGAVRPLLEYFDAIEHTQEFVQIESWQLSPQSAPAGSQPLPSAPAPYVLTARLVYHLQPDLNASE